jgi:hypothetical protein
MDFTLWYGLCSFVWCYSDKMPVLGVIYGFIRMGTVPMMSSVIYINSYLTIPIRNKIQKVIPYVAVIIGVLFILRGLGLGIPYVSPSNMSLLFKKIHNVINTIFNI